MTLILTRGHKILFVGSDAAGVRARTNVPERMLHSSFYFLQFSGFGDKVGGRLYVCVLCVNFIVGWDDAHLEPELLVDPS